MEFFKKDLDDLKRYKNLIKMNDKNNKKHDGSHRWSEQAMVMKIVQNATMTNGDQVEYFASMANWLAIRMKYMPNEVLELMINFFYGNINYSADELYGIKIFDVMKKRSISYVEAVLVIYEEHTNFQPTKELAKYNRGKYRGFNMHYAYLDEDGKICYNFEEEDDFYKLSEEEHQKLLNEALTKIHENRKKRGLE